MKSSKLHKELCDLVIQQAKFWKGTNDILSPTIYSDNLEAVDKLYREDKITEEDIDTLTDVLDELYHQIIRINCKKNKMGSRNY